MKVIIKVWADFQFFFFVFFYFFILISSVNDWKVDLTTYPKPLLIISERKEKMKLQQNIRF